MGPEKEPSLKELMDLVKAQGVELQKMREQKAETISAGTVSELMSTIKAQGEQLKQFQASQVEWRQQWEADMATAAQVQLVPYEDITTRQEKEAERLAREIAPSTHQAAATLLRKIKNKIKPGTWDHIAEGMVKAYQHGKTKGDPKDHQKLLAELKKIIVDPHTEAGIFRTGRKIQSTVWPDVEAALNRSQKAGGSSLLVAN